MFFLFFLGSYNRAILGHVGVEEGEKETYTMTLKIEDDALFNALQHVLAYYQLSKLDASLQLSQTPGQGKSSDTFMEGTFDMEAEVGNSVYDIMDMILLKLRSTDGGGEDGVQDEGGGGERAEAKRLWDVLSMLRLVKCLKRMNLELAFDSMGELFSKALATVVDEKYQTMNWGSLATSIRGALLPIVASDEEQYALTFQTAAAPKH